MSSLNDMLRGVNIDGEFRVDDMEVELLAGKLGDIIDMWLGSYPNVPIEIRFTPCTILTTASADVNDIGVYVLYNASLDDIYLTEAKDALVSLLDGEFPDIKGVVNVNFVLSMKDISPAFVYYATERQFLYGTESICEIAHSLVVYHGCTVSVPVPNNDKSAKTIYVHLDNPDRISTINRYLSQFELFKGVEITPKKENTMVGNYYYVFKTDKIPIPVTAPYIRIDQRWLDENNF